MGLPPGSPVGEALEKASKQLSRPVVVSGFPFQLFGSGSLSRDVCGDYAERAGDGTTPLFATNRDLTRVAIDIAPTRDCDARAASMLQARTHRRQILFGLWKISARRFCFGSVLDSRSRRNLGALFSFSKAPGVGSARMRWMRSPCFFIYIANGFLAGLQRPYTMFLIRTPRARSRIPNSSP